MAAPDIVYREFLAPTGVPQISVAINDPWEGALRMSSVHAMPAIRNDREGRIFLAEHADRARLLVTALEKRHTALARVASAVAAYHATDLSGASLAFRALHRRQIAVSVNLHESTVSRVVKDRWVQLPTGVVIPFARLFGTGHDIRSVLAGLLDSSSPCSDRRLAELLAALGFCVSRRTVAKYRLQLKSASTLVSGPSAL